MSNIQPKSWIEAKIAEGTQPIASRVSTLEANSYENVKVQAYQTFTQFFQSITAESDYQPGDQQLLQDGSIWSLKNGGAKLTQAHWLCIKEPIGTFAPLDESGLVPKQYLKLDCGQLSTELFWLKPSQETIASFTSSDTVTDRDLVQTFNVSYRANSLSVSQTWAEGFPLGTTSPVYTVEGPAVYSNGVFHAKSLFDPNQGGWRVSTATLRCTDRGQTEELVLNTRYQSHGSSVTSRDFVAGSLCKAINDRMLYLKGSKAAVTAINRFSSRTFDGSNNVTFTLNPNFWAAEQDVTCVSIGNSFEGQKRGTTLISPRHVAMAQHYPISDGAQIYFAAADGTLVTRTLVSSQIGGGDVLIGLLDSDVPQSIKPAQVLTSGVWTKAPHTLSLIPQLLVNQFGEYGIRGGYSENGDSSGSSAQHPGMSDYLLACVMFDSGQPGLLFVGNNTVLTFPTHWSSGTGESLLSHFAQINTTMTSLGGGYQLTGLDLTPYNSY